MKILSPLGLQKISELQDKYKFQNTIEIIESEEVIDFLERLRQAHYIGLNVDDNDMDWINETIELLTS